MLLEDVRSPGERDPRGRGGARRGGARMKNLGRLAALAGFLASLWLLWRGHPGAVLGLMRAAGAGLILAGLAHVLPMMANARDWQSLIRGAHRPGFWAMLHLVWLRESVNGCFRSPGSAGRSSRSG